jgi:hypothetical protein
MGSVEARFRFQNELEVYSTTFHLVPNCIHDVILGKAFLKGTSTFKSHIKQARRVMKRLIRGLRPRHFSIHGSKRAKM